MPSARSRLADIEGPGLGKPLSEGEIVCAAGKLKIAAETFLLAVDASKKQRDAFRPELDGAIAGATARQLREIEEGEEGEDGEDG